MSLIHLLLAGYPRDPGYESAVRDFQWFPFALAPLLLVILLGVAATWRFFTRTAVKRWGRGSARWLRAGRILGGSLGALALAGFVMSLPPLEWKVNTSESLVWIRFAGIFLGMGAAGAWVVSRLWRPVVKFQPHRREFLEGVGVALMAAPFAAGGWGFLVERNRFRAVEVEIPVPGLPQQLHGFRLAQLSDIHIGSFLTRRDLAYCVDLANSFQSHLAVITGDLVTGEGDPLEDAIAELARLKSAAGVLGCMGNHEIYAGTQRATEELARRVGIEFLRGRSTIIRHQGAAMNVAGVDYQRRSLPYLVEAEKLVRPGMPNVLLSHNPDVFRVAAHKGFAVTLAGHTHGGQVSVEILDSPVNFARFMTPYIYGLYREEKAAIYVTRGIGTVGVPVRLGAPPEVALIRLCAI